MILPLRHQNQYNLGNWSHFCVPKLRSVNISSKSVRYLCYKNWKIIPTHIKESDTTDKLKIAIKK